MINFLFRNQIMLGLLAAVCLFVPWRRRRDHFALRFIAGIVLPFIVLDLPVLPAMPFTGAGLLLETAFIALLVWGCFDCGAIHTLFSTTCAYSVQHITSKLTYSVAALFWSRGGVEIGGVLLILLVFNVIVCAPILLWFTRNYAIKGQLMFDSVKTVVLSGVFFAAAIFLSSILENNLSTEPDRFLASYYSLNALCILFAAVILSMEFINCSVKRLENEKMILEQMLRHDKEQYEQARRDMEKINIRYHDLKQQYTRSVDDEERARLEAEMKALDLRYFTGDKALDIVLTKKAEVCEAARIQFLCSVDGKCLSGVKQYHIYSLLGNAIDNAVECLSNVEDPARKIIDLDISRCRDMSVIRIENYTPAPPVLRDGALVTTKQDPSGHGYGVKSIKNIAELYGGTADYFVEDEVFCLVVTLPCRDRDIPAA